MGIRKYIYDLMTDRRGGFLGSAVKHMLFVISLLYGSGIKIVNLSYAAGIRKRHKAGIPVISVGNITLGGTGKTPFTIFLADHLVSSGVKPAILTRGYGGDESRMMKDDLPDVPVFVGQDRVRNARKAARAGIDVIILDDGYQHRRLERDLNIAMIDSMVLFGNGQLFPRGILREPVSSLRRADILVLTKSDMAGEERHGEIMEYLKVYCPGKPVIRAEHRACSFTDVSGAIYHADTVKGHKVLLVSGIVDPEYFNFMIAGLGAGVVSRFDFMDHHKYTQADVTEIYNRCSGAEKIITTKKDYVKLRGLDISCIEDKLFVFDIVIDIVEGKEELLAGLNSRGICKRP
ncbi:MAG: tetraacyldisaccharide 4'-kinase [Candidatus Omnitrophota bacterium]